ncbi:diguanylate cyclase DgcJ [Kluyvera ascorbata]|uniref:diguanylate cyclase DgcJ n=1 Tax=Kluyvera ascorbata TaxID=51288 RepID=UPI0028DEACA0|nr:diguanylate cyclase DgcJ [Kluyvera ascorbata]MDT8703141.1 diguanylate cyclase DgcJ [Kluyvera ascorbata]HED1310672.1 diguanylate cyclase [Kluyvera ascorbata]
MKLQNKILRFVISSGVVILTSSFLIYELVASHRDMSEYMRYIIDKGESAFLYEKYQNQLIISQFAQKLDERPTAEAAAHACASVQHRGNIHGLNIDGYRYSKLSGSLTAGKTPCDKWVQSLPALEAFDAAVDNSTAWKPRLPDAIPQQKRFRYYIDVVNQYIYFNSPVVIHDATLTSWNFLYGDRLGISPASLENLFLGRTVVSSIYIDTFTHKNILTFLTPLYHHENLQGIVMVDLSHQDLHDIFYTRDRPHFWRYLDISFIDSDNNAHIEVHRSTSHLLSYVHYSRPLAENMRVELSLDVMYFLLSSWKLFLFYLISTAALLQLVRTHFRLYRTVSQENISDALTGLYNRKILSSVQSMRLQRLTEQGVGVVVIALDCDRLKIINDTWGHDEGDRVIIMLAQAISATIRKSDYGVRLGGDEFCIILIDYEEAEAKVITERIQDHLALIDTDNRVSFSWGAYKMRLGDSLDESMKIADQRLYQHKQRNKTASAHAHGKNND